MNEENNTPAQIPVDPEIKTQRHFFEIVSKRVFIVSIIFFSAVVLGGIFTYTKDTLLGGKGSQTKADKERVLLKENRKLLDDYTKNTGQENQLNKKAEFDKLLSDQSLSDSARKILELRKALIISAVRGGPEADKLRDESAEILAKLISQPATNDRERYLQDFAIVAFVHQQGQCCGVPDSAKTPYIVNIYKEQEKKGYSRDLSEHMTLFTLINNVSKYRAGDISVIGLKIYSSAKILDMEKNELNKDDLALVRKTLEDSLKFYPEGSKMLQTDLVSAEIEPKLYFAYGFDIFTTDKNSKLTKAQNAEIDKNYEDVYIALQTAKTEDLSSLKLMQLYNSSRYLRSMDKRYEHSESNKRFNSVIEETISAIQSTKETKDVAKLYFTAALKGGYTNMSYIIKLANTNKVVANYMNSIGVDYTKIK